MLLSMQCREIAVEKIDFKDETFRISEEVASEPLLASLREIGQLNPVVLAETGGRYRIVCGFRRLHALRKLNTPRVAARFPGDTHASLAEEFDMALWDNLSHRNLEPLETARVVFKLKNDFCVSDDVLIHKYFPPLGLPSHPQSLHAQILLHSSPPAIRKHFREGRLTLASVERLSAMPPASVETIAGAMRQMRLSASLQRKFFTLLEDLAAMNHSEPADPLGDARVADILGRDRLSPGERGDRVYAIMYEKRYPRLSQAEESFLRRKKSLGLPGSVRITPDPYFEKPDLHVEFTAADAEHFRDLVDELREASRKPELDGLFRIVE